MIWHRKNVLVVAFSLIAGGCGSGSTTSEILSGTTTIPSTQVTLPTLNSALPQLAVADALVEGASTDGLSPLALGDEGRFNWYGITSQIKSIARPDRLIINGVVTAPGVGQSFWVVQVDSVNTSPSTDRTLVLDGKRLALGAISGGDDEQLTFSAATNSTSVLLEYAGGGLRTTFDLLSKQREAAPSILYADPLGRNLSSQPNFVETTSPSCNRSCEIYSGTITVTSKDASIQAFRPLDYDGQQAVLPSPGTAWLFIGVRVEWGTSKHPSDTDVTFTGADGTLYPVTLQNQFPDSLNYFGGRVWVQVPEGLRSGTLHFDLNRLNASPYPAELSKTVFDIPVSFGSN